jgi:hypothetical protein
VSEHLLPARGQKVELLRFAHSVNPNHKCEVREAGRLMPFGLFFGTKAECLKWIADHELECVNLAEWRGRS